MESALGGTSWPRDVSKEAWGFLSVELCLPPGGLQPVNAGAARQDPTLCPTSQPGTGLGPARTLSSRALSPAGRGPGNVVLRAPGLRVGFSSGPLSLSS